MNVTDLINTLDRAIAGAQERRREIVLFRLRKADWSAIVDYLKLGLVNDPEVFGQRAYRGVTVELADLYEGAIVMLVDRDGAETTLP